jgi:hypothetical protein
MAPPQIARSREMLAHPHWKRFPPRFRGEALTGHGTLRKSAAVGSELPMPRLDAWSRNEHCPSGMTRIALCRANRSFLQRQQSDVRAGSQSKPRPTKPLPCAFCLAESRDQAAHSSGCLALSQAYHQAHTCDSHVSTSTFRTLSRAVSSRTAECGALPSASVQMVK